jgi:hypothetical protein
LVSLCLEPQAIPCRGAETCRKELMITLLRKVLHK